VSKPELRIVLAGALRRGSQLDRFEELATADLVLLWSDKGKLNEVALSEVCCAAALGVPYGVAGRPIYIGNDMYESKHGALLMRALLIVAGQDSPESALASASRVWGHNPNRVPLAVWDPDSLAKLWATCESPIEERLALHLAIALVGEKLENQRRVETDSGTFRLDFAFEIAGKKVAIECDGHEFHERTKEQAARDKARDRALTAAGWRVLRFTGSEIWKSPERCAAEIALLAEKLTDADDLEEA
jgi:very-short-patch-repair endonuclease